MTDWKNEIESQLKKLEDVPVRNPLKAEATRTRFISATKKIGKSDVGFNTKQSWWNAKFLKKETFPMKISILLVIISLLFGSAGVTAVAAQTSLPGELVYPVKLLLEDVQIELTNNAEDSVNFALKFANRRFEEIQQLLEDGLMPPDPVIVRWQNHVLTAAQKALESEDELVLLDEIKEALLMQFQTMNQLKLGATTEPWMNQFKYQMASQIGMIEAGIASPDLLEKELKWMFAFQTQLKSAGVLNQWQYMFQYQSQLSGEAIQYKWQYQNQIQTQSQGLISNGQEDPNQNQIQNQEQNQNQVPVSETEDPANKEQEQNGNSGTNSSGNSTQNGGSNQSGNGGNGGK